MATHDIELSSEAVLATRKLFNWLTEDDLYSAGFDKQEVEAFSELWFGIKEQVENIEMNSDEE